VETHTSELLSRLDGVVKTSNGWDARCPCRNDDSNPSLSIHEKQDGAILLHCHRGGGCSAPEIVQSVGLLMKDLLPLRDRKTSFDSYEPKPFEKKVSSPKVAKVKLSVVATYDYVSESGELLFQKVRYVDEDGKKTFRQRKPDGNGGHTYSLGDTPKVLYRLPQIMAAKSKDESIFVVEGEKDADTLIALGACATTMPGGAGKWLQIHTDALAGGTVDVIADNDEPGRKHAVLVIEALRGAGCDVQGWICPTGKDITDFITAGGSTSELVPFEPSESDNTPITETMLEEASDDVDEEEEFEEIPQTQTEIAISKLRDLLENNKLTPTALINRASLLVSSALSTAPTTEGRLVNWQEFVGEADDETYDWLIPGLLERRERVIVVAAEGVGKTMLARQVGIATSWGVQPFTFNKMRPIRTLTVDLENPEKIIRRSSRNIMGAAASMNYSMKSHAHLLIKPDGLNLLSATDRLLLEMYMEQVQPELLILGPLYKSFLDPGNKTSEAVTIEVVKYLDTLRVVYDCALWLEHHAPLGESQTSRNLRPFGSAVWSRWPEFGISLQPDPMAVGDYVYDVKHFRGERDERQWPTKMRRGKKWPFEPIEFKVVKP
jgi:5S rRNA maturation endonuclease (ribonuclease M5)